MPSDSKIALISSPDKLFRPGVVCGRAAAGAHFRDGLLLAERALGADPANTALLHARATLALAEVLLEAGP